VKKQQLIVGTVIVVAALAVAGGALFFAKRTVSPGATSGGTGTPWHRHEDEALAEARDRKAPILVDFYADWCEPCVQMDQEVFSTDEFREKAKDWVLFRVDATHEGAEVTTLLTKYQVAGLPSLRFRRPDGSALPQFDVDGGIDTTQLSTLMDEARDTALR
jgi:thiol:disulfide interchange protein DsbD